MNRICIAASRIILAYVSFLAYPIAQTLRRPHSLASLAETLDINSDRAKELLKRIVKGLEVTGVTCNDEGSFRTMREDHSIESEGLQCAWQTMLLPIFDLTKRQAGDKNLLPLDPEPAGTLVSDIHAFDKRLLGLSTVQDARLLAIWWLAVMMRIFDEWSPHQTSQRTTDLTCGTHERLLPLLVEHGFMDRNPDGTYSTTEQAATFKHPACSYPLFVLCEVVPAFTMFGRLVERLREQPQQSSRTQSMLTLYHDVPEGSYFHWLSKNPALRTLFHNAMVNVPEHPKSVKHLSKLKEQYECDSNGHSCFLVDLGGADGTWISRVSQELEMSGKDLLLADIDILPAKKAKNDGKLPCDLMLKELDFCEALPADLPNSMVWHINGCLHDFPRDLGIKILSNIASRMADDAHLYIYENVADASNPCIELDLMLMTVGGEVRWHDDFLAMFDLAGLQEPTIQRCGDSAWSLLHTQRRRI